MGVARFGQDLAGLLAHQRGVGLVVPRAAGEGIGKPRAPEAALRRMILFLEEADILEMRIGEQVVDRIVAGRWDVELVEKFDPFVRRLQRKPLLVDLEIGGGVFCARRGAVEAGIGLELRPADRVEEGEGLGVGVGPDRDVAVLGRQGTIVRAEQPPVASRSDRRIGRASCRERVSLTV